MVVVCSWLARFSQGIGRASNGEAGLRAEPSVSGAEVDCVAGRNFSGLERSDRNEDHPITRDHPTPDLFLRL